MLQRIEVISFSYPNLQDIRLSNVDMGIDMGTCVAIVGPNDTGKSPLPNLLAVRRRQKLRIGRHSRHLEDLLTMEEAVHAKLRKFGLPGHNHLTPIANLSGGQKVRVMFTLVSMYHLDTQSIVAVAVTLDEFAGGVVLVSHDSRLI
ncbi:hypothetical protein CUMW_089560 [Citrus unshiu]|nr:hypothetical protein CUMW_089560 [Citrus unshiu]